LPAAEKVMDLKIADYVMDVEPSSDLDYQDALIVAMKEEKAAFRLYSDLAAATDDEGLRATLLALAQEEAKHKLRFEIEYDDHILSGN
jgi:rubrerythrin